MSTLGAGVLGGGLAVLASPAVVSAAAPDTDATQSTIELSRDGWGDPPLGIPDLLPLDYVFGLVAP